MRSFSFRSNLQKLSKKLVKGISHFDSPTPICINMNSVKSHETPNKSRSYVFRQMKLNNYQKMIKMIIKIKYKYAY